MLYITKNNIVRYVSNNEQNIKNRKVAGKS